MPFTVLVTSRADKAEEKVAKHATERAEEGNDVPLLSLMQYAAFVMKGQKVIVSEEDFSMFIHWESC